MTTDSLSAVMPALMALAPGDVDEPRIPMATALQEGNDLLLLVNEPNVGNGLVQIGVDPAVFERLRLTIEGARQAQSSWIVQRDASKSDAQRERERRGKVLRADLLAACRWSLRKDRGALGTLALIVLGEGVPDLIQDLNDLSELITRKRGAFAPDTTLDASRAAEAARSLASELSAGTSAENLEGDQAIAKNVRDRAYTVLEDLVSEIRTAGQYAFRKDEELRTRFTSQYLRSKRRRRSSEVEPQEPVPEEAGEG